MLLLGMVAVGSGCHDPMPGVSQTPQEGEELPILRQTAGEHSHETRAMQVVVRDAAMLARISLEDIQVDFAQEMVLIVTLGQVTSDQYRVGIDRVWREGSKLHVAVTIRRPPPGSPVAMATPYCLVVVPRCDLNIAGFKADLPSRDPSWQQSPPPSKF